MKRDLPAASRQTENDDQSANDVQKSDNPLSELLHKDLKKFTWVDVGRLSALIPAIVGSLSTAPKTSRPIQANKAPAPIESFLIEAKTKNTETKKALHINQCEKVAINHSLNRGDETCSTVRVQGCMFRKEDQRSTDAE